MVDGDDPDGRAKLRYQPPNHLNCHTTSASNDPSLTLPTPPPHSAHLNRPTSNTSTSTQFNHLSLKPSQPPHLNLNHLDGPTTNAAPQLPTNHFNRPPSTRDARRPFAHALCQRLLPQCPQALPRRTLPTTRLPSAPHPDPHLHPTPHIPPRHHHRHNPTHPHVHSSRAPAPRTPPQRLIPTISPLTFHSPPQAHTKHIANVANNPDNHRPHRAHAPTTFLFFPHGSLESCSDHAAAL